jgi:hypothetical protein
MLDRSWIRCETPHHPHSESESVRSPRPPEHLHRMLSLEPVTHRHFWFDGVSIPPAFAMFHHVPTFLSAIAPQATTAAPFDTSRIACYPHRIPGTNRFDTGVMLLTRTR